MLVLTVIRHEALPQSKLTGCGCHKKPFHTYTVMMKHIPEGDVCRVIYQGVVVFPGLSQMCEGRITDPFRRPHLDPGPVHRVAQMGVIM